MGDAPNRVRPPPLSLALIAGCSFAAATPPSFPQCRYVLHILLMLLYCAQLFEGYGTGKRLVIKAAADYHLQPVDIHLP